jgi:hypothetical protein
MAKMRACQSDAVSVRNVDGMNQSIALTSVSFTMVPPSLA